MKFHFMMLILLSFLISTSQQQKQEQQCLFIGCKCDGDEPGQGGLPTYEIICDEATGIFPSRDTSRTYSNLVTAIEIVNSGIKKVPENHLNGLEIDLLDLSNNEIRSLSRDVFRGIIKLEQLDLTSNNLERIDAETFKPLENSLVQLKLGRNKIGLGSAQDFSNALNNLKNLTVLALVHNEIRVLPDLSKMTSLNDLSLSSNFISSLTDDITKESLLPSSLIELNLNENRLSHLTESSFANLKNLKYLSLESNLINSISELAFSSSFLLTSISLSKNYLNHIPGKAFFMLNNLQRLDLSSQNQILKQIDNYAFDRYSSNLPIRRIDLSNNRISKIEEKAFCSRNRSNPYINVKEIDLAANPLSILNVCLVRQLATGFKDPNQQSKAKLSFKANEANQQVTDYLKCDCEITKSSSLIDLEGNCKNEDGNLVPLKQFRCTSNEDLDSSIETVCSMSIFNCVYDQNKVDTQIGTTNGIKSHSTEAVDSNRNFNDNSFTNNKNRINNNNLQNDQKQPKNKDSIMQATKLPASAIVTSSSTGQQQISFTYILLIGFCSAIESYILLF
jgi:Leucine-rich repeat (LRR) protein